MSIQMVAYHPKEPGWDKIMEQFYYTKGLPHFHSICKILVTVSLKPLNLQLMLNSMFVERWVTIPGACTIKLFTAVIFGFS